MPLSSQVVGLAARRVRRALRVKMSVMSLSDVAKATISQRGHSILRKANRSAGR